MEQQPQSLPINSLMFHVAFWVIYWVFASMQDVVFISQFKDTFNLPTVLGSMGVVYFNYYYWIPKYMIKQRRVLFYAVSILSIVVLNSWLVYLVMRLLFPNKEYYFSWEPAFIFFVDTTVLVAFTTAFKFIQQWHERNNYAVQLEKKNLESELEMLKSQINPHFIFNTLNTIYFLMEQKEDVRAKEALLKFSDTLSHQLYDYNKDWIDLGKEVDYLQNYIELQRLRHDEELLDLKCELPDHVNGYVIAPMLLIPFVENAFKYSSNSSGYRVGIQLSVKDGLLDFTTENSINQNSRNQERVGGIGLKNVQRRLALTYPGRHELDIVDDGETYKAHLKIKLK
ncbi:MAG: sensor histidine kinase [Saprospiraceae bacterium]|nr:sensor histidine kinase [Saprospiraceae bacterium]